MLSLCCLWFVVCCLFSVVCYALCVVCFYVWCLVFVVCCGMWVVRCVLFAGDDVCCSLVISVVDEDISTTIVISMNCLSVFTNTFVFFATITTPCRYSKMSFFSRIAPAKTLIITFHVPVPCKTSFL